MTDFYWIKEKILTILLTTNCNQNCIMCPQYLNDDFEKHDLIINEFIPKIKKLHVNEIYITGGEPFLKYDLIEKIFDNTKSEIITILTNGTIMPSKKILSSGRVRLCIPLYASFDDLHNSIVESKNFYKVITNLIEISEFKIPIELRFVITKKNYQNMLSFSEFVTRNLPFVSNIAFMGIELMEQGFVNVADLWIEPKDFMPFLQNALDYLTIFEMSVSIYNIPQCVIPERFHSFIYKSISPWKRKFLDFCTKCKYFNTCGGFFESCTEKYKEIIKEPVL